MNNLLNILEVISQLQAKIDVKAKVTFSTGILGVNKTETLVVEISAIIKEGKFKGQIYSMGHSSTFADLRDIRKGGEHFILDMIAKRFNQAYQEHEKENQP